MHSWPESDITFLVLRVSEMRAGNRPTAKGWNSSFSTKAMAATAEQADLTTFERSSMSCTLSGLMRQDRSSRSCLAAVTVVVAVLEFVLAEEAEEETAADCWARELQTRSSCSSTRHLSSQSEFLFASSRAALTIN